MIKFLPTCSEPAWLAGLLPRLLTGFLGEVCEALFSLLCLPLLADFSPSSSSSSCSSQPRPAVVGEVK